MKIILEENFQNYTHSYENRVEIPIEPTDELNKWADQLRLEKGKTPLFTDVEGIPMDEDGWYEMRLIVDKETQTPLEIEAWVEGANFEEHCGVWHLYIVDQEDAKRQLVELLDIYCVSWDELKESD